MLILNDQNFEEEVLKSDVPVLIDFYADWCGPCQMYGPIIEEMAQQWEKPFDSAQGKEGKMVKVGKINVDQAPQTAQKYGIMSIPATLIIDKGMVVKQMVGMQTKETLEEEINKIISK